MTESDNGLSDAVNVDVSSAEQELEALVAANNEAEQVEQVEEPAAPQRRVVDTEIGWTAQSQHGVHLNHFVPAHDYSVETNREDFVDGGF